MFTSHLLTNGTIGETTIVTTGLKPSKSIFHTPACHWRENVIFTSELSFILHF